VVFCDWFISLNILDVHPYCRIYQYFIVLYCWAVDHYMNVFFIHSLRDGHLVVCTVLLLWIMPPWHSCSGFCVHRYSYFSWVIPKSGRAGSYSSSCVTCRPARLFSDSCTMSHSLQPHSQWALLLRTNTTPPHYSTLTSSSYQNLYLWFGDRLLSNIKKICAEKAEWVTMTVCPSDHGM
jgi:hypothetical protein